MATDNDVHEKIERLKKISLFKEVADNKEAMEEIACLFKTAAYSSGDTVIEEGDSNGDSLFIIKTGTVEIIKKTMQGDPYVVATLSAQDNIFFGEIALLDKDERSATVKCKTDCEFYILDRSHFLDYGNKHPTVGLVITRELSHILCKRLRKSNIDIITLFDALVEEVERSGGLQ